MIQGTSLYKYSGNVTLNDWVWTYLGSVTTSTPQRITLSGSSTLVSLSHVLQVGCFLLWSCP